MKLTRIVLVGLGIRGNHWRFALEESPVTDLIGVIEVRPEAVAADIPLFGTVEQAIEAKPDGVIVATPPETHPRIVEALLKARIPVLCEKPLSETLEEAR